MGENKKDRHKFWDTVCPACSRKYLKSELAEEGFVDKTPVGEVIYCKNPKCEYQWLEEK